ncbi:MAG: hypothetical protein HY683_07270, partial [Chloroflexi bacterium]|nr:hypothetical protein [Chloroflexota bacterium]
MGGAFTLQIKAGDDQGLSAVEYAVGGGTFAPMNLDSASGLFEVSIDSKALGEDSLSITVRATDKTGQAVEVSTSVMVDNRAPSLQIISPAEGTPARGLLTLQVQATDDMGLPALEYELGDGTFSPLKLNTETGRYEAFIDSKALKGDRHSLTIRARDSVGNTAQALLVMTVDNEAPRVRIVSPRDEALASGTLTLQARAEDDVELMAVEYTLDGEVFRPLNLNGAEGVYEAAIDTKDMKGGEHSLTIRAKDSAGNTARAAVAITVDN